MVGLLRDQPIDDVLDGTPRRSAISAGRRARPSSGASDSMAVRIVAGMSLSRRRGTRIVHVRSRKCRRISRVIVGTAKDRKSGPRWGSNRSTVPDEADLYEVVLRLASAPETPHDVLRQGEIAFDQLRANHRVPLAVRR